MKSCCDEYCSTHGCNQGRDCPVRMRPQRGRITDEYIRKAMRNGYKQDENIKTAPFVLGVILITMLSVSLFAILS